MLWILTLMHGLQSDQSTNCHAANLHQQQLIASASRGKSNPPKSTEDSTFTKDPENKDREAQASSNHTTTSEEYSIGKQSALQQYLNVPTNDGTHRITFRWKPSGDFRNYNEHSTTWLTEAHSLMSDLFTDEDCSLFRWESKDLKKSNVMSELSPGDLREFLSPNITFLPSTSQIIFGARVCFAAKFPGQWKNKERTRQTLQVNRTSISISNSTTTSGKDVIAGYILLKAARTTHRTRFLQSLRKQLPPETPFFNILQFHRTPMEQKITHLAVQCGENHVAPLSKALSELLTGRNSSLYLPRIALSNLTPSQISSYFEMQDQYSKSLKSLALYPTLQNLDKPRKEYFEDGTVMERSTRDWAATIFRERSEEASARCEVVNGGFDQKAYLLVPHLHFPEVQEQLRQYRLRVNPIGRREARFRDSLPGLPAEIHIDTSTQHNLDFLAHITSVEVWQRAPPSVRNHDGMPRDFPKPAASISNRSEGQPPHIATNRKSRNTFKLSTLGEDKSRYLDPEIEQGHDDQTTSTKSATQSVMTPSLLSNTTARRLNELEALFRSQQQAISETSKMSKETDKTLQHTIATLQENSDKLVLTMERQQDAHVQLVELSTRVSRLTDVMDRIASQMDALTKITLSNSNTDTRRVQDTDGSSRRRTIEDMSVIEVQDRGTGLIDAFHSRIEVTEDIHEGSSSLSLENPVSPIKKKSRQAPHDRGANRTLLSELEEMSLGSAGSNESEANKQSTVVHSVTDHQHNDHILVGGALLDDTSDDFSATIDALPDLDTQYNTHSDPEGGEHQ